MEQQKNSAQIAAESTYPDPYTERSWIAIGKQNAFIAGWKANPATWTDEDVVEIYGLLIRNYWSDSYTGDDKLKIKKSIEQYKQQKEQK